MISRSRLLAALSAAACLAVAILATPASAAAPAWQPIAVSGPTNLPPLQSETQRVAVDAEGGTFTLTQSAAGSGTLSGALGTGNLTAGSNTVTGVFPSSGTFTVGQTLFATGIPAGTTITTVTNSFGVLTLTLSANAGATASSAPLNAGLKDVTGVSMSSGALHVGDVIAADGIPAGTTIAGLGAGTITLSTLPTKSGVKALTASETTEPIAFDAPAAELEAKLSALAALDVTVKGGPGGNGANTPYFVTFGGDQANTDVAQLSADASSLTGSSHTATVFTTVPGGSGTGTIAIYVQNIGGLASSGTTTLTATLPPGIVASTIPTGPPGLSNWSCSLAIDQQSFTCVSIDPVQPGDASVPINAPVRVDTNASGTGSVEVTASGGGAANPVNYSMPLTVSSTPAEPGVQTFTAGAYDENGLLDTRAGGHPYSGSTAVFANTYRNLIGKVIPVGEFKDIIVDLPPGFLGNPVSTPQCSENNLFLAGEFCPSETMVGRAAPVLTSFGTGGVNVPVYNIEAPLGYPGKFFFKVLEVPIHAVGSVRSDEDYGLTVGSYNTAQIATVYGSFFTFWGSPADPAHDEQRCLQKSGCHKASTVPETAFLSGPTDCAREAVEPPIAKLRVALWQSPLITHTGGVPVPAVNECDKLKFEADFTFEPGDTKSDSPASFRTELTVPSEGLTDPDELMTPTINESVVDLPKGVVLNASAADGLGACSKEQIGLKGTNFPAPNRIRFTKDPQTCPDSSKIGSGELKSELLEDPLQGALYLAAQGDGNPFGSLFAIYLVIEDPRHGIFIKLPGEVQVNGSDGQQRIVFRDLPQLPFTYLRLNLKGGNRSPLASPPICGKYVTTTTNTPWSAPESGPPTTSANGFEINQGPNGGACSPTMASRPFNLGLKAGTDGIGAGAFSPLTFQITRPDGAQEIDTLELTTAKGLAASLKGIPNCPEAAISAAASKTGQQELSSPACPGASQIGRTLVGSGSGPTPFYSGGKLYLAGPYKGAPLSVVAITPAVAGPFDLGNVVVRTAVFLNRSTAQVTAKADPIPQILKGVPLRIRDVRVILDRPGFSLNPTSCDAGAIDVKVTGNSGATANLSNRFQVAGCQDLAFKPKFSAKVVGGTKRGDHPKFIATVDWPQGAYANTKDVAVTLPRSEFLDQANIRTICTRVQAAADQCPEGAIYGEAEAITPLLDEPLKGPVFLKSSDNKLPDLAIKLRGPDSKPVEVEFQGRIDSIGGRIRNTIEGLPDVPVSKFVLRMQGGRKGLLVNSRNLCTTRKVKMEVRTLGQNNKRSDQNPVLKNSCKPSQLKAAKRKAKRAHRRNAG